MAKTYQLADAERRLAAAEKLATALEDALPWLERGEKFYKYQRVGREFWPNREEAEATTQHARAVLAEWREANK